MPAAGHARLRDRRKESTAPAPSFGHTSRRRSHLSFLELTARGESFTAGVSSAEKTNQSSQLQCSLEPISEPLGNLDANKKKNKLCEPCQVLATTILASCELIDPAIARLSDAWTKTPGPTDTLILTNHHGQYGALVASARHCQLCHLLSTSWYTALGRKVRGFCKYRIQRGKHQDHVFSLWTQKIDFCTNGCCSQVQQGEYQRLRAFEPFFRREDAEPFDVDAETFSTKNDFKTVYGREVPFRSDSGLCTQMIARWLRTCRTKHPDCSRTANPPMPKRLIDVRPPFGGEDCRLIIRNPHEFTSYEYVALSHCWGGRSLFCTTRSNYRTYMQRLRFEDFPKTFRDAVILTRALGFRYLWIDALCILQGDVRDWEEQADEVGRYYRDAILTISAMRAPDYNAGLFHPRKSISAELYSEGLSSQQQHRPLFIREAYSPTPTTTTKITGPVSERAWVLQERLLSPAVLHFTKREIVWECRTQTLHEHGGHARPLDYETKLLLTTGQRTRTNRSTPGWNMPRKDRFREWYRLVQIYSAKKLTRTDDRLPAISGLARRFHDMCHTDYLAGLWREDALRGLLWNTTDQEPPTDGALDEPSAWHSPSWSWAATARPVSYNMHLGDMVEKTSPKHSSTAIIARVDVDAPTNISSSSFGHVMGGCLEITGLLRPAHGLKLRPNGIPQMRWDRRPNVAGEKLWALELGSWEVAVGTTTLTSPVTMTRQGESRNVISSASATIVTATTTTMLFFLLLEAMDPLGIDATGYQRVGLAWCEWKGEGKPVVMPVGQMMKICIV